ncbi:hypothetical protein B0H15DRAFT_950261 [Mycena belliarum]|uniref:Uncharacterized protein n=1 Tax=Mycena belliarum TaxID=1033014 RepID=A0AAD6TRX8_9AGAR|nr:hypothetical protein B0H15DRAFT_955202 [Mycena belliae]KAJ7087374.1 hypothetical protein B0H15DRAFT_950261 [Mycena belliae]
MSYDIVSGVMREAGRVMAERLLPSTRQRDRRDYGYDDYDRRRSRSPRPYSSSGSSVGQQGSDSGASYRRRDSSPFGDQHDRRDYRRGDDRPAIGTTRPHTGPDPRTTVEATGVAIAVAAVALTPGLSWHARLSHRTSWPPLATMAATRYSRSPNWRTVRKPPGLDAIREPRDYMANENRRREVAIADEAKGKVYRKVIDRLDPLRVAVNILRWVHAGDTFTAEFLKSVQTRLGTDPTLHRTQGEVTLLQHQMDAMRQYNAIIEGRKIARTKTATTAHPDTPFQAPPLEPVVLGGPDAPVPGAEGPAAAPLPSTEPPDEDDPMTEQEPSASPLADDDAESTTETPAYLGAFARFGMRSPLLKAKRWYANLPTAHWPKGMRVSHFELPSTTSAVPHDADVRAWFTINALSPSRARWNDINALEFTSGFPASLNDVANIVVRDEDLWVNLRHGAVRTDASTLYPSHPAGDVEMRPLPEQTAEELAALQNAA